MTSKEKCELLKQIRKEIADKNGIAFEPAKCYAVDPKCGGTCPKCDEEIRYLDAQLNKKAQMGGKINVAGVALEKVQTAVDDEKRRSLFTLPSRETGLIPPPRRDYEPPRDDGFELPPEIEEGRRPGNMWHTMGIIVPPSDRMSEDDLPDAWPKNDEDDN